MIIQRSTHLGMCFGVRDAVALAVDNAVSRPVTILGDLVHNESVLAALRAKGVRMESRIEEVKTPTVVITAHGASRRALTRIQEHGLGVVDATCPLVRHAHQAVMRLVEAGYHPVIIGQRGHVEVRGITEDLAEFDVVLNAEEISGLRERPRFGIVAQTTQPIFRVRQLVTFLQERFPHSETLFVDTVCQPTKQRQSAAVELARRSDVVVVIGGLRSNNTRELAATCETHCKRVHLVQCADDIRADWFTRGDKVGMTAGTSTPDDVIDGVERRLGAIAEFMAVTTGLGVSDSR